MMVNAKTQRGAHPLSCFVQRHVISHTSVDAGGTHRTHDRRSCHDAVVVCVGVIKLLFMWRADVRRCWEVRQWRLDATGLCRPKRK